MVFVNFNVSFQKSYTVIICLADTEHGHYQSLGHDEFKADNLKRIVKVKGELN